MSSDDAIPLEISPETARDWVRDGDALIIDVREGWELDICSIDGAAHIPLQQVPARLKEIPHDRPVIVTCHHGMRSMQAVSWLRANGYGRVTNLQGGIDLWSLKIDSAVARY